MNPHVLVKEKPSHFSDYSLDSERAGKCSFQLGVILDLDDPVSTLPLAGVVGTLIGDQLGGRTSLSTQLQTTVRNIEIGVLLEENAPGLRAQSFADLA